MAGGERKKVLFLKKKNQKDFSPQAAGANSTATYQKFFASFFQKRSLTSFRGTPHAQ